MGRSVAFDDPSGAVVPVDPVAVFHALDANFGTGARCVQEVVVAEIDTDVRESAPHRVEEDEVARTDLRHIDGYAGGIELG